jgi:hypothetical protein
MVFERRFFEKLATGILTMCYDTDSLGAERALLKRLPEFGAVTCVQVASTFNVLSVISHPCFQDAMTEIWYYRLSPDTPKWRIAVGLVCPLLAPLLIEFKDPRIENTVSDVSFFLDSFHLLLKTNYSFAVLSRS